MTVSERRATRRAIADREISRLNADRELSALLNHPAAVDRLCCQVDKRIATMFANRDLCREGIRVAVLFRALLERELERSARGCYPPPSA